jgi:hypothetical protein
VSRDKQTQNGEFSRSKWQLKGFVRKVPCALLCDVAVLLARRPLSKQVRAFGGFFLAAYGTSKQFGNGVCNLSVLRLVPCPEIVLSRIFSANNHPSSRFVIFSISRLKDKSLPSTSTTTVAIVRATHTPVMRGSRVLGHKISIRYPQWEDGAPWCYCIIINI